MNPQATDSALRSQHPFTLTPPPGRTPIDPDVEGDVLFITDMARLLRTSRSTIERRRRDRSFPFPELPVIDSRPRWSRRIVEQIVASGASIRRGISQKRGRA